ncbi:MAG: multicopper oxidase domain-containing protein, partial [Deltaproteobacteria bacterium]|nr:multicopper oxidase domain-containing protein [Deltaproteobacteria bacterium]
MVKTTLRLLFVAVFLFSGAIQAYAQAKAPKLVEVTQKLVAPPFLPEHDQVAKGGPKLVKVELVIEEKKVTIAENVKAHVLTFNGSVPGPIIVVHQNDYVELTLTNPKTSTLAHNIDLHAVTGALGGGGLTLVNPGESAVIRFK